MLPLLEMCQIRLQDVSLQFSKASKLYGVLCDCEPNMTKSWKVTLPHRAGHRGSGSRSLAAAKHRSSVCHRQQIGEGADRHTDAWCQKKEFAEVRGWGWDPGEAAWVCSRAATRSHVQRFAQDRASGCRLLCGALVTQLCLGKQHHFQSHPNKNSCSEGGKAIFSPKRMSAQEFISEEIHHLTPWCRPAVSLHSPPGRKDHSFPPRAWCGATFS